MNNDSSNNDKKQKEKQMFAIHSPNSAVRHANIGMLKQIKQLHNKLHGAHSAVLFLVLKFWCPFSDLKENTFTLGEVEN